ncbi:MAG: histidinol-phosphate transaminase [Gemmataceae bacterium]
MSLLEYLRRDLRAMAGYTPGEQPRGGRVIKLNTNENPYPPSPQVIQAIRETLTGDHLRKYPDPLGTRFRETAGRILNVDPDGIVIGNGSDDVLTILTRAFVPAGGRVLSLTPSYLLYRTLAELQGARFVTVPFGPGWSVPAAFPSADLMYVANPNSPSGTTLDVATLLGRSTCPVVVDEAYGDFAERNALEWARSGQAIVTRSLSKSYALAGMRFGFAVTTPEVAGELNKVKDSYNCDVLSLAAATAALEDQEYMLRCRDRIRETREQLARGLIECGFRVTPSQANFVWAEHERPVRPIYEELKRRGILIRYMFYDGYGEGLRVSVGTEEEIETFLEQLRKLLETML